MVEEGKEADSALVLLRAELARVHHLDWLALATFALLAFLALALLVFHELLGLPGWPLAVPGLMALALAAGGAHALVGNAGDYWISFSVVSQAARGGGLVDRGIFPSSLIARPPRTLWDFIHRLLFGARGALLLLYYILCAVASFSASHHYLVLLSSFVLSGVGPLFLIALSIWVSFTRVRHVLLGLLQEAELAGASAEELAERHCSVAETLMLLSPPRTREAISHYEIALELQPENVRAREGFERLKGRSWPSRGERSDSAGNAN